MRPICTTPGATVRGLDANPAGSARQAVKAKSKTGPIHFIVSPFIELYLSALCPTFLTHEGRHPAKRKLRHVHGTVRARHDVPELRAPCARVHQFRAGRGHGFGQP